MNRLSVLLLVCVLSLPVVSSAQSDLRFGLEASPFLSWLSSDWKRTPGKGPNLGFGLQMHGMYQFHDRYALKTGLGISFQNGGKLEFLDGGEVFPDSKLTQEAFRNLPAGTTVRYRLQYVEIPVSLRLRTNEIGYARYFAEVPIVSLGFLTQARGDLGLPGSDDENVRGDTNFLQFSLGAGVGVEYAISSSSALTGGLFYHYGFADVLSDTEGNPGSARLRRLAIRIGIDF